MKRISVAAAFFFVLLISSVPAFAKGHGKASAKGSHSSTGVVHVRGYTKKNGTYVAPHDRTAPNQTKNDNWSTVGNVNPETGKPGTKPGDGGSGAPAAVPASTPNAPDPAPAPSAPSSTHVRCCDGTLSPTCTTVHRGCCSHHGGACS